jgi:hypothetical protein
MGLASFQAARRRLSESAPAPAEPQQEATSPEEPGSVADSVTVTEPTPDPVEPQWTMSMSPQRYLARHPDGTHADLARRVIANGD